MSKHFAVTSNQRTTPLAALRRRPEWQRWLLGVAAILIVVVGVPVISLPIHNARRQKESLLQDQLRTIRYAIAEFVADTGYYPVSLDDLNRAAGEAPTLGVDDDGRKMPLAAADYQGPYLTGLDAKAVHAITFHDGYLPTNPYVSRRGPQRAARHWRYANGQLHPAVPRWGKTLDGVAFQQL